jgi:hypothetical protein
VAQDRQGSKAADGYLDMVQEALGQLASVQVSLGDTADRFVHRLIVVRRRHDQVAHRHQVVVADAIVVDQGAARCFDDADALAVASVPLVVSSATREVVIVQQILDRLGGVQHLEHARPMVGQRCMDQLAVHRAR